MYVIVEHTIYSVFKILTAPVEDNTGCSDSGSLLSQFSSTPNTSVCSTPESSPNPTPEPSPINQGEVVTDDAIPSTSTAPTPTPKGKAQAKGKDLSLLIDDQSRNKYCTPGIRCILGRRWLGPRTQRRAKKPGKVVSSPRSS